MLTMITSPSVTAMALTFLIFHWPALLVTTEPLEPLLRLPNYQYPLNQHVLGPRIKDEESDEINSGATKRALVSEPALHPTELLAIEEISKISSSQPFLIISEQSSHEFPVHTTSREPDRNPLAQDPLDALNEGPPHAQRKLDYVNELNFSIVLTTTNQ
jgi:hypothetical protein